MNGNDADRKKDKSGEGKLPIHVDQNNESENNRDWVLEDVAAHLAQRYLHRTGIVADSRHQDTGAHPIKKIHRLIDDLAEKLVSNVGHNPVAHPIHVVSAAVTKKTARRHYRRDQEAVEEDRIYRPAGVEYFRTMGKRLCIGCSPVKNRSCHLSHRERETAVDYTKKKTEKEPENQPPFVGRDVAIKTLIWFPGNPNGFAK